MSSLRIVLLGENEAGKCAAANTILGREAFLEDSCINSVCMLCEEHEGTVEGRRISVINTPALFRISLSEKEQKAILNHCVSLSSPCPHVFLLVVRMGKFTEEQKNTVKWIQENFGNGALKFTMVLFTNGLQLVSSVDEYLKKNKTLQKLVDKCGAGYHVLINNENKGRS